MKSAGAGFQGQAAATFQATISPTFGAWLADLEPLFVLLARDRAETVGHKRRQGFGSMQRLAAKGWWLDSHRFGGNRARVGTRLQAKRTLPANLGRNQITGRANLGVSAEVHQVLVRLDTIVTYGESASPS